MFELLAGLGAGLQVYGAIKGAQDQADVDRQKALFQRQQADEVDSRARINDVQMQDTEIRSKLQFGSQYAASGHEGTGIGSQLEIQRQEGVQQSFQDREAAFQSKMLREGSALDENLAKETEASGYVNAAGTLLGASGKIMQPSSGFTGPKGAQGLPPVPEGY